MQIIVSFSDLLDLQRWWHWVWPPSSNSSSTLEGASSDGAGGAVWHLDHLLDHLLTWWNIHDSLFHAAEAISIGWRRRAQTFKVRWLRRHLLMSCFQTGWWNHEKPVCQNLVQKKSVANGHSCREGDWLELGISAGAPAASRYFFWIFRINILHTDAGVTASVSLSCFGPPFYSYISCKNNQNSTFLLSTLLYPSEKELICFYCCKQKQP